MPRHLLVTGCSGLIGSEAVRYFDRRGDRITGLDNNMRRDFFGPMGDTIWNLEALKRTTSDFRHVDVDIRDRERVLEVFRATRFDAIIHCAAQPSHDKAREIPLIDFDINASGTMNVLEAARLHCPEAAFIHMSTNKVYGDAPNDYPLVELETRYDYARPEDWEGVAESCRIDQSLHSVFGASKAAGDLMAQEYGRYFGLPVGIFRGGCLTGPAHSGVELHGFLSYLARVAVSDDVYTVFGYKGKQVRDQIHSLDVIRVFDTFIEQPRAGEVYNLGGGRGNSASVLECIALMEEITGRPMRWRYVPEHRVGDHICYISDMRKFQSHFPKWEITRSLSDICQELIQSQLEVASRL